MRQSKFTHLICNIELKRFRKLLFMCPICSNTFRNFSMPYHIFQYHFDDIENHLTKKEIAKCCSMLMEKEYKKFEIAFKNFIDLSILFRDCDIRGVSIWREKAENSIEALINLKIKNFYKNLTVEDAKNNLSMTLPLNKNKNAKRKYKKIEDMKDKKFDKDNYKNKMKK